MKQSDNLNYFKMEKIPSAEEFLLQEQYYQCSSGDADEIQKVMKDFAKLHVTQALKEASKKAEAYNIDEAGQTIYTDAEIDKESILNAYPLDLIK